jgi:hypothetical protein
MGSNNRPLEWESTQPLYRSRAEPSPAKNEKVFIRADFSADLGALTPDLCRRRLH